MSDFNLKVPRKQSKGQGCLILFGFPFFAAGCFVLWSLVISPIIDARASSNWVKTPCKIIKSELETTYDEGATYKPIIHYTYEYDGKAYQSEKVDFSADGSSSDLKGENKYVNDFPLKSSRFCYVNPDKPEEAVLVKDWGRGIFKWVAIPFGGVFAFIGFGLMLAGASPWIFNRKKKAYSRNGEVTLKPTGQRLVNLGGALFICVFWNGIVSVFLVIWIGGLLTGSATGFFEKWGLGLFLIPFVCVGTWFLWRLYKEVKKLFAPSISLTVKPGLTWKCGDEVKLSWNIPYSAKIDKLILDFICKESATYSQGSSSTTDEEVVCEFSIYEKKSLNFTGNCKFTIPLNLMPSFESNNNQIEWGIRVQTEGEGPCADDFYVIDLLESR